MLLEALVLGGIIGKARKGSFKLLGNNSLEQWWYMIGGIILILATLVFAANNFSFIEKLRTPFVLIGYVMILWSLCYNFKKWPMIILVIGMLLNFAPIALNNGLIPIDLDKASLVHGEEKIDSIREGSVVYMDIGEAKLSELGKTIIVKKPYPLPKVLSIGDIVLSIGVMVYIQWGMCYIPKKKNNMLRFSL